MHQLKLDLRCKLFLFRFDWDENTLEDKANSSQHTHTHIHSLTNTMRRKRESFPNDNKRLCWISDSYKNWGRHFLYHTNSEAHTHTLVHIPSTWRIRLLVLCESTSLNRQWIPFVWFQYSFRFDKSSGCSRLNRYSFTFSVLHVYLCTETRAQSACTSK